MIFNKLLSTSKFKNPPSIISNSTGTSRGTSPPYTLTINKPSDVQEGDLLLAFTMFGDNNLYIQPSGWEVWGSSGSNPTIQIYFKIANNSEPASYDFVMSSGGTVKAEGIGTIICCRNSFIDVLGDFSSNSPALSITPTSEYSIVFLSAASSTSDKTYSATSFTSLYNSTDGNNVDGCVLYKTSENVATGDVTVSDNPQRTNLCSINSNPVPNYPSYVNISSVNELQNATSLVLDTPSGTQDNDLMIAYIYSDDQNFTYTVPTGWTKVVEFNTDGSFMIAYKTASSEGSTHTFDIDQSNTKWHSGYIITYRDTVIDSVGSPSAGTLASGITVSEDYSRLLYFAADDNTALISTGWGTEKLNYSNQSQLGVYDKLVMSAGFTGDIRGVNDTISGKDNCVLISIKPV
jgi:hypothetical protein